MSVTCTRKLTFSAGHRVFGHESKCAHLHGHNWAVYVTAQHESAVTDLFGLDSLGRVIDFGVLKERVGAWLEDRWDHGFILFDQDEQAITAMAQVSGQKVYTMRVNPTAENLARYILTSVGPQVLAGCGVRLVKVQVWETENCYAEATL